jgi:hypothetical protein
MEVRPGPGPRRFELYGDIAVAPNGDVAVSWLDLTRFVVASEASEGAPSGAPISIPDEADFHVAVSKDGGVTFGTPVLVDSAACICCRTAIASAPHGGFQALWRHVFLGNVRDPVSARVDVAGKVGVPVRLHEDGWVLGGCPDIGPDVLVESDGAVRAAWYTGAKGRTGLYSSRSLDGRSFSAPDPMSTGEALPTAEVKLAYDGRAAWAVFEEPQGSETRLVLARASSSAFRKQREPIGTGRNPAIAAAPGRYAIVWERNGALWLTEGGGAD